jgi:beta-1,4-mannosyltransferase
MQYHAHALAASGVDVSMIGYQGAPLPKVLSDNPRISIHRFYEPRFRWRIGRSKLMYGFMAFIDGFRAAVLLGWALLRMPRPNLLLVQNPPGFPMLHVAWVVARLRGARFVIDWHNLGFTILALRLGRRHPAVRLVRWVEMLAGRRADAHLCVSRGFVRFLADKFASRGSRSCTTGRRQRSRRSIASSASRSARPCSAGSACAAATSDSSCARPAGRKTKTSTW